MSISRDNLRNVTPYTPGEQPQFAKKIKLNTNENPYPPSPEVEKTLVGLDADKFRLYPDPNTGLLREALAKRYNVTPDQVFTGVGSDEVIALCFQTYFNSGKPILFPEVSYSFYKVWADIYKVPYKEIPLKEDFSIDPEDYKVPNGGVIFPNPNAPTSRLESLSMIEEVLKANPDVAVIIDEAYIDFAGEGTSALALLSKYDNLVVTQTFSKSRSMAGMRIGFAIASREMISYLNDVKNSFNSYTLNYPAIVCGAAAVEDEEYFRSTIDRIIETRDYAEKEFKDLGFTFSKPSANFLFVKKPGVPGEEIFKYLRSKNIFVRHFNTEKLKDYLRVTVGTREEMEVLFREIRAFLAEK